MCSERMANQVDTENGGYPSNVQWQKKEKRQTKTQRILVKNEGNVLSIDTQELLKACDIEGIIRFHKEDFKSIDRNSRLLTHFNLQYSNHRKRKRYALLSIIKQGYYNGKMEILPILSSKGVLTAECIDVRDHVPYSDITENDFHNSLPNIKNISELKYSILKRYKDSMSHLSDEKKLALGVGITYLGIIDDNNFKNKFQKLLMKQKQ